MINKFPEKPVTTGECMADLEKRYREAIFNKYDWFEEIYRSSRHIKVSHIRVGHIKVSRAANDFHTSPGICHLLLEIMVN